MSEQAAEGPGAEGARAERLLKVSEVCDRLNLSSPYVYELMNRGELPYVRFGKARRVKPADLEALIERSTVGGRKG